jgi:hypothetical protein
LLGLSVISHTLSAFFLIAGRTILSTSNPTGAI